MNRRRRRYIAGQSTPLTGEIVRVNRLRVVTTMVGVLVGSIALGGCASDSIKLEQPQASPTPTIAGPTTPEPSPEWDSVEETGIGPAVITITRPSEEARYLHVTFSCGEGTSQVVLREDPRVAMAGTCGGGQGYQMTLPPDVDELHVDITVGPETPFRFRGRFSVE